MLEAKQNAAKPQLADLIRPKLFHPPIASQAPRKPVTREGRHPGLDGGNTAALERRGSRRRPPFVSQWHHDLHLRLVWDA